MQQKLRLDGIVTLVDAKHVWQHLDESAEVQEQIAFADIILLNKIDLVAPGELKALEARIRSMNAAAKIERTRDAAIDLDRVLHVGGFNLDRALEVDPQFMEPEYPFEWAGVYQLEAGAYTFAVGAGADPAMNVVLLPLPAATPEALTHIQEQAVLIFSDDERLLEPCGALAPGRQLWALDLEAGVVTFRVQIADTRLPAPCCCAAPASCGLRGERPDGRGAAPAARSGAARATCRHD
jgi:CobW/HypB/UreG, nucleotide-binding domain